MSIKAAFYQYFDVKYKYFKNIINKGISGVLGINIKHTFDTIEQNFDTTMRFDWADGTTQPQSSSGALLHGYTNCIPKYTKPYK